MQILIPAAAVVAVFVIAICQFIAPINMFGLTSWGLIAWGVCVGALVSLFILVVLISRQWLHKRISYRCFHGFQGVATVLAMIYAIWCTYRLILNGVIPKSLDQMFVLDELIAYIIFWVLMPPTYFFVEYQAVDNDCIIDFPKSDANLKTVKEYADNASKIWAGVLALLAALIALKTGK
jgi:amino acid transporter